MKIKRIINDTFKVALSLFLGGAILYWMYRGFDFKQVEHVMFHEMNWTWMLLSFPFGIMAQVFRGWRWRQTLDPMGEEPRAATAIHAVFVSYAVSLVIPRIGEFARCAVLRRYDKTDFAQCHCQPILNHRIHRHSHLCRSSCCIATLIAKKDGHI